MKVIRVPFVYPGRMPAKEMIQIAARLTKKSDFRVNASLVPWLMPCGQTVRYRGPISEMTPENLDAYLSLLHEEPEKFGDRIETNASNMFQAALGMCRCFKKKVDLDITVRGVLHQMRTGEFPTEAAIATEALSLYMGGDPIIDEGTFQFFGHGAAHFSEFQLLYLFSKWPYISAEMKIDEVQLAKCQVGEGSVSFDPKILKEHKIAYELPEMLAEVHRTLKNTVKDDEALEQALSDVEARRLITSRFIVVDDRMKRSQGTQGPDDIRNFPG